MDTGNRADLTVLGVVTLALCVLGIGVLWIFFSEGGVARRAHREAVSQWERREPAAYSFDFTSCNGMCASCPLHISVADGDVTGVESLGGNRCSAPEPDAAPTIEDVFALEEGWRTARTTVSFEIRYDEAWGFPATGSFFCPDGYSDCGSGFGVSNFTVLARGR